MTTNTFCSKNVFLFDNVMLSYYKGNRFAALNSLQNDDGKEGQKTSLVCSKIHNL